jgi:hypothetical protein
MLDIVLNLADNLILDVKKMKENVRQAAPKIKDVKEDKDFDKVLAELIKQCTSPTKGAAAPAAKVPVPAAEEAKT